jgi:hypothetical protein
MIAALCLCEIHRLLLGAGIGIGADHPHKGVEQSLCVSQGIQGGTESLSCSRGFLLTGEDGVLFSKRMRHAGKGYAYGLRIICQSILDTCVLRVCACPHALACGASSLGTVFGLLVLPVSLDTTGKLSGHLGVHMRIWWHSL